jgi:hypothetical protein
MGVCVALSRSVGTRCARLAFAGRASVPYAGAVPDGGRHGFTAAVAVVSPHRLAA